MGIFSAIGQVGKMSATKMFIEKTYKTKASDNGVIWNLIFTLGKDFGPSNSKEELATIVIYFYTGFYMYGDVNPESEGILNMPDTINFWAQTAENLKTSGKIPGVVAGGCVRYLQLMANNQLIEDILDVTVLQGFLDFKKDFFNAYPKN